MLPHKNGATVWFGLIGCLGVYICVQCNIVVKTIIIIIRFLILMLKMRMVHHMFLLDLQRCIPNPQVSVMVQPLSFRFRVYDDDGYDVLHSMPGPKEQRVALNGHHVSTFVLIGHMWEYANEVYSTHTWRDSERKKER